MNYRIVFYHVDTGNVIINSDLFVMNDRVYSDNFFVTESQEAQVAFDDFIVERPEIAWRPQVTNDE